MLSIFLLLFLYDDYDDTDPSGDFAYFINKKDQAVIGVPKSDGESAIDNVYSGAVVIPPRLEVGGKYYEVSTIYKYAFYKTEIQSISLPESITKIGDYSFSGCCNLELIDLSKTQITAIPSYAFFNTSVRNIMLPENITTFGEMSFAETLISTINVPNDLNDFGNMSFYRCKFLKSIDLKSTHLLKLSPKTFKKCVSLSSIMLPETLTSISDELFVDTAIKSIEIPTAVTSIGVESFAHCTKLLTIAFPAKISSIGEGAFKDCLSLNHIDMSKVDIVSLPAELFRNCDSLEDITFPPGLTEFNDFSMAGTHIKQVKLGADIVKLGKGVFSWCVFLQTADLSLLTVEEMPCEIFRMCSHLKSISLPPKVTTVSIRAFQHCVSLETSDLSKTNIKVIGSESFSYCISLGEIVLPDSLTTINESAFASCNIKEFSAPSSLEIIGPNAFFSCRRLVTADLTQCAVTKLSNHLFAMCTSLSRITLPSKLTAIGDCAFSSTALTTISLSSQISIIGSRAFENCISLKNADLSQTKVSTLNGTFRGCVKLATFKLPPELTCMEDSPFLETAIVPLPIPESLTSLGPGAFANTTFNGNGLPGILTTIGKYAFAWCASLQNLDLSQTSIVSIGDYAFYNSSLKSITWPTTIKIIGAKIFENTKIDEFIVPVSATNLSYGAFEGSSLKSIDMSACSITDLENRTFAHSTLLRDVKLPAGLLSIGMHCFFNCAVSKIELPSTLMHVGPAAFGNTHNLQSIDFQATRVHNISEACFFNSSIRVAVLPTNCTIGDWAFSCSDITALEGNIRELGNYGFFFCHKLTRITLNNDCTFTDVSRYCFSQCMKLVEVTLPHNITSIQMLGFNNCTSLRQVNLQDTMLRSLGYGAFANCTKLSGFSVPTTTTQIGDEAFLNTSIFQIEIGKDVNKIGAKAFRACTHLKNVDMSQSAVTIINNRCFSGCFSLTDVQLPLKLERIGNYAFEQCGLTYCTMPETLKELGRMAYSGCFQLRSADLSKATMKNISCGSFSNCTALTSVVLPDKLVAQNALTPFWVMNSYTILTNFYNETGNNDESQDEVISEWSEPHEFVLAQSGTFSNCPQLSSLDLSKTQMTRIEPWFLYNSSHLTAVTFSPSIESIGEGAFGNTALTRVNLPPTINTVGASVYRNCKSLAEINMTQANLTQISSSLFMGTRKLKVAHLPPNISNIGSFAFLNSSIPTLELPPTLESMGRSTFSFSDIEKIDFSNTLLSRVPDHCFLNASKLKDIKLSKLTTIIGRSAFANSGIEEFILSEGVEYIEPLAFFGCRKLKVANLTKGKINRLPYGLFSHCSSLETIYLPSNLQFVDETSFEHCTSLQSIYYYGCNIIPTNALASINSKNQVKVLVLENYPQLEFMGIRVETFYDSELEDAIELSLCAKKIVVRDPRPRVIPGPKYPKPDEGKLVRFTYNEHD